MISHLFDVSIFKEFGVEAGFALTDQKYAPGVCVPSQIHGAKGIEASAKTLHSESNLGLDLEQADFVWTSKDETLGIFVADCTAILILGRDGEDRCIAAVHAGWRGTAEGVIENALSVFPERYELLAWLSPRICQTHFEVGEDVVNLLGDRYAIPVGSNKFLFDLGGLQKEKLISHGVHVVQSSLCTFCQPEFYSYRKSKAQLKARHLAWIRLTGCRR